MAAALTPANVADNEQAPALLRRLSAVVRCILGDRGYQGADLSEQCWTDGRILITSRRGK
ncbi:MAG: transposase [Chloroflexi bacterium]|nr:transposase [Chloroflexota bacterium]